MTKDEIFAAMAAAYTGTGSTIEGSFAGDILRACADGATVRCTVKTVYTSFETEAETA